MNNPRFVWSLGPVFEEFPDVPESLTGRLILWDRQERKAVLEVHPDYIQAICLTTTQINDDPFSNLEHWFNAMTPEVAASEGLVPTDLRRYG